MVLLKEQTSRSMEPKREPRNRSTQIQSTELGKMTKGNPMEKVFTTNDVKKKKKVTLDIDLTPVT